MGYIHTVNITNDGAYLIEPILFATTTGTAAALAATITNFELVAGVNITLKITTTNTANATLSINSGAAKPIYYNGAAIVNNILKSNFIYTLIYDGSVWHVTGEKLSNTEITLPHKLTFGSSGTYQYDGSADVTVPVYTGGMI